MLLASALAPITLHTALQFDRSTLIAWIPEDWELKRKATHLPVLSFSTIVLGISSATSKPKTPSHLLFFLFSVAWANPEVQRSHSFTRLLSGKGLRSHRAMPCSISCSLVYSLLAAQNCCNSFHSCRRACVCHVTRTGGSHKATVPNKSTFAYTKTRKFKMTKLHMLTSNYLIYRKYKLNVCSPAWNMHYIY